MGRMEADSEHVWAIEQAAVGDPGRRDFLEDAIEAGRCYVARLEDDCAGLAVLDESFYGNAFISLLIVRPEFRRKGVATALIRHLESICPTKKLFTSTNQSNVVMQKLCERLGFARSGRIENLDEGDPRRTGFRKEVGRFREMSNRVSRLSPGLGLPPRFHQQAFQDAGDGGDAGPSPIEVLGVADTVN